MFLTPGAGRSVLQRRSSISNTVQAGLDGLTVLGVAYWLVDYHIGELTAEYTIMILLLMGALAVIYDHYAIYRSNANFTRKVYTLFKAWTATFAFLFILGFLTKHSEQYSRLLVGQLFVAGYVSQLLLHLLMRALQGTILKHAHKPENAVIIGTGRLANFLYQKISSNPWLDTHVVGCVKIKAGESAATPAATQDAADDRAKYLPLLGDINGLEELIELHSVRTVYFVTPLDTAEVIEDLYFKLLDKHITVHWIPDIFSLRLVNHSVREIAGIPVITLSETPLTGTRLLIKSLEDFLLSALILILISPVLLAVAIAIKLDSQGPVFFRQQRMGWNGKIFRIWKFRSMHVHQPENGVVVQAQKNDPRVTRVGAFIRRTSLDELPQVFNVLMGDMSLVGPRPHAIQHDEEYSRRIADYFARHNIKPGITGLAQVRGYRGETRDIEKMIQRVESDIEYINNWSLALDLSILLRTITVFTGKNAY
jgi:putative colanic acid biosynthesis UDP-glucose lipid carrier transferase